MKKLITLTLATIIGLSALNAQTFFDDFESYTVGSFLGTSSPEWTTWSNTPGSTEDVVIVDNDAASGTKSIYFSSVDPNGGPQDVVLPFGGVYTSGQFTFSSKFKVPSGNNAYFNFQAEANIGVSWALDCIMATDGNIYIASGGNLMTTGLFPQNTWFEIKIEVDLSANNWEVFIDNVSIGSFINPTNQIASLDIFPIDEFASFWVDDVSYVYCGLNLQPASQSVNISANAQFTTSSPDLAAIYQWQTDIGSGFQNITGSAQYSGETTEILNVSTVTMSNNGQEFRCIISTDSCTITSDIAVLTVIDDTGINKISDDRQLMIYPNPSKNRSFIEIDLNKESAVQIDIYQVNGALVVNKDYGKLTGAQLLSIETAGLDAGIYFVNVVIDGHSTMKKLVVNR